MEISPSPAERREERLTQAHLGQAVQTILEDGFVILRDVVDHDHLDALLPRMTADSERLIAAEKWGGAGRLPGHLQQGPPPIAPYVFKDIVANPFAIQVTHSILGDGMYNRFYNGNTNCPNSPMQPLHADAGLWPGVDVPHPPTTLIVNVSLVDVTEENGSTQLWPGTHLLPTLSDRRVDEETEARRKAAVPPVRANTRKGSLVIRDARLWHRGMPNLTNTIRHMIALIHNIHWLASPAEMWFDSRCRAEFPDDDRIDFNARFTEKPIEYLFSKFAAPTDREAAG